MKGKEKVVLGLSGGVDSAVAAALLSRELEVHCLYLEIGLGGGEDAAALADLLKLPFSIADIRTQLEEHVCAPFAADYLAGRTPLPCARCNPLVKFPALLARAEQVGAHWVATGHYARTEGGCLFRGKAVNDQSYLLAQLPKSTLKQVFFPLGGYEKGQVRTLAGELGLPVAQKPDSMEICFVPDDDYAAWLETRGAAPPPGEFIDPQGRPLGRHKGIHHYTLGQRRGLGVPAAHRLFVSAINPMDNTVTLSDGGDLGRTEIICTKPNWFTDAPPDRPFICQVRLRHSRRADLVEVTPERGGQVTIHSRTPLRAPTPGQLAVFYEEDRVLGSAWIKEAPLPGRG